MSKLLDLTQQLMQLKTTADNLSEIEKIINLCQNYFSDTENIYVNTYPFENANPVLVISNTPKKEVDVIVVGHLDVVPAEENQFIPKIEGNRLIGRGSCDMKSWAAVSMTALEKAVKEKLNCSVALIFATDEEVAKKNGIEQFIATVPYTAKVVLDIDVADDINKVISKAKCPLFIELTSSGKAAHGAMPWEGKDAIEQLMQTIADLRKHFPYYNEDNQPQTNWVNTMHVGKIEGGNVVNMVAPVAKALIDVRLTDSLPVSDFINILKHCLHEGVSYVIQNQGTLINIDTDNEFIKTYLDTATQILQKPIQFISENGATDSRFFYQKGIPVIMHSGSGQGMHSLNEWGDINSMNQLMEIQIEFFRKIAQGKGE